MALVLLDRVQQTGTANTTVSFTLSGSVIGYQSFSAIGNGNTTFYAATDVSGSWEVGIGTYATGGTLTRTTILSSSNSGSAVTFSGTVNVFVTYPSEKSVNLDASGNVSALGTITSGVWNGTTVPVAYGGTGVTASSGANSVVLRDANQNIYANSVTQELDVVTSAAGTTVLTLGSSHFQILTGTTTQTFQLPDATTLPTGSSWIFDNDSTGNLYVVDAASGAVDTVAPGGYATVFLELNGTTAGTWGRFGMIPSEVNWGTNSLDMGGSTVITNGIWQGTPVASGYGGTGLTTFSGANNALYSTGASTLTAGTLPVAAGGTGATTLTQNGVVYGNGTSAAGITAAGTTGQVLVATTSGAPSWGSVPAGSITGTVPIANGGTGQTTAGAAFNALSPITTTGDLIVGNGTNSATRLGVGSTGQVLTVSGGTATWATPSTGAGTITRTDFTATAGQTVFSVTYTVGLIDVYRNGIKLGQADFTATNGTSFTLATGAAAGDLIQAEVFSSLNIYSTITSETFNGTGSQTVFTMSAVPANTASLLVAISGVVQDPTTYSVSSNTLTFSTAPPSGSGNISVRYLGVASVGTVGSFSAGTTGFTPSSATTGAVTLAGTLNVANGGTGQTSLTANNVLLGNGTSGVQVVAPSTTGNVLTSNGTTWTSSAPPSGGQYYGTAATKAIAYNANSIAEDITILANTNGLSAGPITISTGYTVTVATDAVWVIV